MDEPTANASAAAPTSQPPVIGPGYTLGSVTDKISAIVLTRPTSRGWYFGFFVSFTLLMILLYALAKLVIVGVGIWGINIPVGWGFAAAGGKSSAAGCSVRSARRSSAASP